MKYEYNGNVYNYVGVGKFKDSTGKWVDAIIYERDNHIYMREITDFIDKFKKGCILNKMEKIPTEQNKHLPCVTDKVYEITLYLMFNREFMNDVYRTFRIISRGL